MPATPDPTVQRERAAATIRRLAPRLSQLVHERPELKDAHECVVLLKHLQPGRAEEALRGYRVFAQLIRDDFGHYPGIQPEYADLLDRLATFLEWSGYEWGNRCWRLREDGPAALGPRLAG